jgi:signal transduction histidine kinase
MTASALLVAALYGVPAIVWAIITQQLWWYVRMRRPESLAFRLMPLVGGAFVLHYALLVGLVLAPPGLPIDPWEQVRSHRNLATEVTWLLIVCLLRHLVHLLPIPERRPSVTWLVMNYGLASLAAIADAWVRLHPGTSPGAQLAAHHIFEGTFTFLVLAAVLDLWRVARPGAWGPEHAGEPRRPDLILVVSGSLAAILVLWTLAAAGRVGLGFLFYEAAVGLAIATPFVLRMLSVVVTHFTVAVTLLGIGGGVLATRGWALTRAGPAWQPFLDVATLLLLGAVFVQGRRWLNALLARALHRNQGRQAELLDFVHTLSPEVGVHECCRRALGELARVWGVPGAAIFLRDGDAVVHGVIDIGRLLAVWPRGDAADVLPRRNFGSTELRELPIAVREALTVTGVGLGTFAILSPRRRWGHLFLRTGLLRAAIDEDEVVALAAFTDQLALLLDSADLLARAVAIERSLAHAEKLAAVGELAARIAHEIRNPVTAARSLAQQLVREPGTPFGSELGVILEELERVERQVASLLRFARREQFRFTPVDLADLVRGTVASLGARLDAESVDVGLDLEPGVLARADADKVRQLVLNLLENALDALATVEGARQIDVAVAGVNGHAVLAVEDNGPGVPADVLPRLFEPFFSLKPHGTGLGLAIAKRTVDAHGGRLSATSGQHGGLRIDVELPLAGAPA